VPVFSTTPLPTQVYVAPTGTGVYASCTITNISPAQTLFVGLSACTPNTGLPLPPNAQIRLPSAPKSLYASSNWAAGAAAATASASAATAGTSSWTVASGGMPNIPVGTYFLIGSGTGQEALCVATSASTTTITTTTASLFDHSASEILYAATTTPGSIRVERSTTLPPTSQAAFQTR
jgi:hypothetical protein